MVWDWNVVVGIAQIIGVAVQCLVLVYLVRQVQINDRQLAFAKQQHSDLLAQMRQDKIDAVWPSLTVDLRYKLGAYVEGNGVEHPIDGATCIIKNTGRGPAQNVSVSFWSDHKPEKPVCTREVESIAVLGSDEVHLHLYDPTIQGTLVVSFNDQYGNNFQNMYEAGLSIAPDGEEYAWIVPKREKSLSVC